VGWTGWMGILGEERMREWGLGCAFVWKWVSFASLGNSVPGLPLAFSRISWQWDAILSFKALALMMFVWSEILGMSMYLNCVKWVSYLSFSSPSSTYEFPTPL